MGLRRLVLLTGGLVGLIGCVVGIAVYIYQSSLPREAPEAEKVLSAQLEMPFQALIPGFLPWVFDRTRVQVETHSSGPSGAQVLRIVYPTFLGDTLEVQEWQLPDPIPDDLSAIPGGPTYPVQFVRCECHCRSETQCDLSEMEYRIGSLHVLVKVSAPDLLSAQELQFILNTMGPAGNRKVFTSMEDVPITNSLPPAVDIPIDAEGIQALTLIVASQGYTPAHFAVKKGIPVKLTFRQLGQVGCGNELILQQGGNRSTVLTLKDPYDKQEITFTPDAAGDFKFNCPHLIYQGVMTVRE